MQPLDIAVLCMVACALALSLRALLRRRRSGGCGCGCSSCPYGSACSSRPQADKTDL